MDGSSAQADDDAVITGYLVRVRKAARHLPRGRREWVIAHIGDRLADALEANDGANQDVRATLARFGQPRAVVLAVDGHNPGAEASWLEYAAILLVLAGGVLWRRHRARWRDKSELNTPAGSTAARSRRKSSSRWYILGISSAGILESLAR